MCSVSDAISECAGSVRENIQLRRAHRWTVLHIGTQSMRALPMIHRGVQLRCHTLLLGSNICFDGKTAACTARLVCPSGVIASYLHASTSPGLGKMVALVALVDKQGKLEGAAAEKAQVDRLFPAICTRRLCWIHDVMSFPLTDKQRSASFHAGAWCKDSYAHCGSTALESGQAEYPTKRT